jgi:hypothetical protein
VLRVFPSIVEDVADDTSSFVEGECENGFFLLSSASSVVDSSAQVARIFFNLLASLLLLSKGVAP